MGEKLGCFLPGLAKPTLLEEILAKGAETPNGRRRAQQQPWHLPPHGKRIPLHQLQLDEEARKGI